MHQISSKGIILFLAIVMQILLSCCFVFSYHHKYIKICIKYYQKAKRKFYLPAQTCFGKQACPAKRAWRVLKMLCVTEMRREWRGVLTVYKYLLLFPAPRGRSIHMRQTWREKGVAFSTNTHIYTDFRDHWEEYFSQKTSIWSFS